MQDPNTSIVTPHPLLPSAKLVGLILLLITVGFLMHAGGFWHYVNDDAYITFRYSANLALGQGPYYNVGEQVEGFTNILTMLLVSLSIAVGGIDVAPTAAKVLSMGAGLIAVWLTFGLALIGQGARPLHSKLPWATVAAVLVALHPSFAVNSTSGLETTLFAALLAGGVAVAWSERQRDRWFGSGILFALLVMTRPEGIALAGVHWLGCAFLVAQNLRLSEWTRWLTRRDVQHLLVNGILPMGMFIALTLARIYLYGEWLPNTYYAKAGGFYAAAHEYIISGLGPGLLWGGLCAIGAVLLATRYGRSYSGLPFLLVTVFGLAIPAITGTDWMPGYRFMMHYLPLAAAMAAIGLASVPTPVMIKKLPPSAAILLVIAVGGLSWFAQARDRIDLLVLTHYRAVGYETAHRALALDLCADTPVTIALMDIGIIGFECLDSRIVDITGLTDKTIAKSPGAFMSKVYDPTYVLDQEPDYIVLTLSSEGRSYQQPDPSKPWNFWSDMEVRLFVHPTFKKYYTSSTNQSPKGLEELARIVGAHQIYEHGYAGHRYLLMVFERSQDPTAT